MIKRRGHYDFRYQEEDKTWYRRGGFGFVVCLVGLVGSLYHPSSSPSNQPSRDLLSKGVRTDSKLVSVGRRLIVEPKEYFVSAISLAREVSVHEQEVREASEGNYADLDDTIHRLQISTLELLQRRYGFTEPHRVVVDLQFPEDFPDNGGQYGQFTIELAPSNVQPHAVFNFLEMIRTSKRIDSNLKQVEDTRLHMIQYNTDKNLAFPEFAPEYPHNREGTVCFEKGGPNWFINIGNNSGSPDTCFGIIVDGYDQVIRMKQFQIDLDLNSAQTVHITGMTVQVPSGGSYIEWIEPVEARR